MFHKNLYPILVCLHATTIMTIYGAERSAKHITANDSEVRLHQLTGSSAVTIKTQLPPELQPTFEDLHKKICTMLTNTPELIIEHPFPVEYLYSNNPNRLVTGIRSAKSLLTHLGLEEHKDAAFVWSLPGKRLLDFSTWSEGDKKGQKNKAISHTVQLDNYRYASASEGTVRVFNLRTDLDNFTPEQLALFAKIVGYIERGKIPNEEKKRKLLVQGKRLFDEQSQIVYQQRLCDILYPQVVSLTDEYRKKRCEEIVLVAPFATIVIAAALRELTM